MNLLSNTLTDLKEQEVTAWTGEYLKRSVSKLNLFVPLMI